MMKQTPSDYENLSLFGGGLPAFSSTSWNTNTIAPANNNNNSNGSINSSSSPESPLDDDQEDDFLYSDLLLSGSVTSLDGLFPSQAGPAESNAAAKKRSRRPPSTAERRATHNAVERARRESLNGRFMELAQALPSMAAVKRPSKSMIVNKSLEFVFGAEEREKLLKEENANLFREVNELRAQLGLPPKPATTSIPVKASKNHKRISISSANNNASMHDETLSVALSRSPTNSSIGTNSQFSGSPRDVPTPPGSQHRASVSPVFNGNPLPQVPPFAAASQKRDSIVTTPPAASLETIAAASGLNANMLAAVTAGMPFPGLAALGGPTPAPAMPFLDVNYFMALQQQQNATGLALNMPMNASMAGWNPYALGGAGMTSVNHPTSLVPDMPMNFAFA